MSHTDSKGVTVVLPWPSKDLSPNARVHWGKKASAVKKARKAAAEYAWVAMGCRRPMWAKAALEVTFNPPTKARFDLDNAVARSKALFDGLSDALGIDDSMFEPTYSMGEVVNGGEVRITVREA